MPRSAVCGLQSVPALSTTRKRGKDVNPDKKRWLILFCGILANMCQGAAYASSVFAVPLLMHLGLSVIGPNGKEAPDMAKWALVFSMNLAMLPIGMLLSGKIADQRSPRVVVAAGGILFGLGVFLAGFSESYAWLCITFGIMAGLGSGAAYGAVVSVAARWFPERRGLASGLAVGALGFGTVLIVPIANWLIQFSGSAPDLAVLFTLKVLGVAFLVIMVAASNIMVNPEKGYAPANFVPTVAAKAASGVDFAWKDMVRTGRFWLLYVLYVCGAFSGLLVISQAKPIVMGIQTTGLDPAALAKYAGYFVMVVAAANATGRVAWGWISDRTGRMPAITMMFLITSVTMLLLPRLTGSTNTLFPAAILLGACYGGYLGIFPPICADAFGGKNMAVNYALLFSGFSVAAIAGPYAAGFIKNTTGSYDQAFLVAGGVAFVGLLFAAYMTFTQPKTKKAAP